MNKGWYLNSESGLAGMKYVSIYGNILTKQRTRNEINAILKLVSFGPSVSFLDAPCGFGRHSFELGYRGYSVTGVDIHSDLIRTVKALQEAHKMHNLQFHCADLREWNAPHQYQVALSLHSGFGYFDTDSDDEKIIQNLYVSLSEHGELIVEYINSKKVIDEHINNAVRNNSHHQTSSVLPYSSSSIHGKYLSVVHTHNSGTASFSLRLYTATELLELVEKSGFHILQTFGGYDLTPFDEKRSPVILIHAKKTD